MHVLNPQGYTLSLGSIDGLQQLHTGASSAAIDASTAAL